MLSPFTDEDCKEHFHHEYLLKAHLTVHLGIRPFKCRFPPCAKSFWKIYSLNRHEMIHSGLKRWNCTTEGCIFGATKQKYLKNHMLLHGIEMEMTVRGQPAKRQKLDMLLRESRSMTRSTAPNDEDDSMAEGSRDEQRAAEDALASRMISGEDVYTRATEDRNAGSSGASAHEYRRGRTVLQPAPKYPPCLYPDCGYICQSEEDLEQHAKVHKGTSLFVCAINGCTYRSTSEAEFRVHMKAGVHTSSGEENYARLPKKVKKVQKQVYQCKFEECNFEHWNPQMLNGHYRQAHIEESPYLCGIGQFGNCLFKTSSEELLRSHVRVEHPDDGFKETFYFRTRPAYKLLPLESCSDTVVQTELKPVCHCGGYQKVVTRSIDVQTVESCFEAVSANKPTILDEFIVPTQNGEVGKSVEYEILNVVVHAQSETHSEWPTGEVPAAQYERRSEQEILPGIPSSYYCGENGCRFQTSLAATFEEHMNTLHKDEQSPRYTSIFKNLMSKTDKPVVDSQESVTIHFDSIQSSLSGKSERVPIGPSFKRPTIVPGKSKCFCALAGCGFATNDEALFRQHMKEAHHKNVTRIQRVPVVGQPKTMPVKTPVEPSVQTPTEKRPVGRPRKQGVEVDPGPSRPASEIKSSLRPKKKPKYRFHDEETASTPEEESTDEEEDEEGTMDDSDEDPDAVVAEEEEKADLKEDKLLPKKRKSTHRTEAVESSVEEHNDVDPGYPETIEGAYGMVNLKELGERMFEKEKARSKAVNLGMEILFSQEEILNGACKGRGGGNREFTVWDPQKLSALYGLFCEWSQRKGLSQPSEKNFHQICINNKTNKRKSLQLTEH
ncbi:hypothetical protein RvY_11301 [Ramazzottius varieornatus]|uniref:C2H2-type domain-containing protein n=1 Tax=Ramazzottius varieornatus TaxID=947166 RepID=A0A1D1VL43_RAMVA|nr:hypothetical protein RvY_11301 [Ramazzottius varieornatus]